MRHCLTAWLTAFALAHGAMPSLLAAEPGVVPEPKRCGRTYSVIVRGRRLNRSRQPGVGVDPEKALSAAQAADGNDHGTSARRSADLQDALNEMEWNDPNRVVDVMSAGGGVHATAFWDALIAEHPDAVGVVFDEAQKMTARVYGAQVPGDTRVNMTASPDTVSRNPEYKLFTHGPDQFQLIGLPYGSLLPSTGIAYATRHTAARTGLNPLYGVKPTFLHWSMREAAGLTQAEIDAWPRRADGTPLQWRGMLGKLSNGKPNYLYSDQLVVSNGLGDARNIGNTPAEKAIFEQQVQARLDDPNHVGSVVDGMYTLKDSDAYLENLVRTQGYAVHAGGGYTSLVNVQNLARAKARLRAKGELKGEEKPDVIFLRGDAADVDIMRLLGFVKSPTARPGKVSLRDYSRLPENQLTPQMKEFRRQASVVTNAKYKYHEEVGANGERFAVVEITGTDLLTQQQVTRVEKAHMVSSAGAENKALLAGGFFNSWEPIFENVYGRVSNDYGQFAGAGAESVVGRRIVGFRRLKPADGKIHGKEIVDQGKVYDQVLLENPGTSGVAIGPSSHTTARGIDGELLGPMATDREQVGTSQAEMPEFIVDRILSGEPDASREEILANVPNELLNKYIFLEAGSAEHERYSGLSEEALADLMMKEVPASFTTLLDKYGLTPQTKRLFTEIVSASRGPSNTSRDSIKSTLPRTKAAAPVVFDAIAARALAHGATSGKLPLASKKATALLPGSFDRPTEGKMDALPVSMIPGHLADPRLVDREALHTQFLNAFIGAVDTRVRIDSPNRPGAGVFIFVQKPGAKEIDIKGLGLDAASVEKVSLLLQQNIYFRQMLDGMLRREGGVVGIQFGFRPDGSFNPIRTRLRANVNGLAGKLAIGLVSSRSNPDVSEVNPERLPDDLAKELAEGLPTRPFPANVYGADGKVDAATTRKVREDYISDWSRATARIPNHYDVETKMLGKKEGSDAIVYLVSVGVNGSKDKSPQYTVALHPNGKFADAGQVLRHDSGLSQALATSYPALKGFFPDVLDVGLIQGRNIGHYSLNEYVMVVQSATGGVPLHSLKDPSGSQATAVGKRIAALHKTEIPIPKSRRFNEFVEAKVKQAAEGDKAAARAFLENPRWRKGTSHGALTTDNLFTPATGTPDITFTGGYRLTEGRHPVEDLQTLFADLHKRYPAAVALKAESEIRDAYFQESGIERTPLTESLLQSPQWRAAHP